MAEPLESEKDVLEPLEEIVATLLEASSEERAERLQHLSRADAERAELVRTRLAALGELGMALDHPPRAAGLPERFGAYRRGERVGGGGMGEVYLARHAESGALAALKLVRPDHLWFEAARARFQREIEAGSELAHPGIVRVLEVGAEQGVPFLVLEWVGGASLDEVLERLRGRAPETLTAGDFEHAVRAASAERQHAEPARAGAFSGASYVEVVTRLAARVAEALAHAHDAGVLHRDVKPANVLVTPAGRVLLADFGLALPRGAERMTRTGNWLGSMPYAAPEQIEGSPRALDPRADVYSLGATLYELVTLRTPFLGGPESVVRRRITSGDLEPPRRLNAAVTRELEQVCLAALDIDPARRPASSRALGEDLLRTLAGQAPRSRTPPPWVRLQRWARRRPRLALAAALAVLFVGGSSAVAWRESALAARLTRLADAELVRGLTAEAQAFWPADPERLADMSAWLARAAALLARAAEHRSAFAELTRRALPFTPAERARDQSALRAELATLAHELEGLAAYVGKGDRSAPPLPPAPDEVRTRELEAQQLLARAPGELVEVLAARVVALRAVMLREEALWRQDSQQLDDFERLLARARHQLAVRATFRFADALDAWHHDALRRLLADLEELARLVTRVEAQRASSAAELERFVRVGRAAWERARAAIAVSPRYGGLELEPLFGLLPLGENAYSGLWEFLLEASGAAPPPGDEPGSWRMQADSGIVLVLLPGGRFRMGQRDDEGTPLVAARPLHEVELAPFFLARHELSAAQAERLGGFPPEKTPPADGRLPLVLDWERAHALLNQHGLELPTEAQWEYAARAGEGREELAGYANVRDRAHSEALRRERSRQDGLVAEFDDGFAALAPIGSLRANAFGLHDMLGNVSEWCLDHFVGRGYSTLAPRARDGLRATVVSAQLRVVRGGSYEDGPDVCWPAVRLNEPPGAMPHATGVRPARSLASGGVSPAR
ncbi:MAG: hypothetical protein EXS08_06965 [Planctomycetes bacterium]|nr:hypothetical protein [Planctomycetota bacterium]